LAGRAAREAAAVRGREGAADVARTAANGVCGRQCAPSRTHILPVCCFRTPTVVRAAAGRYYEAQQAEPGAAWIGAAAGAQRGARACVLLPVPLQMSSRPHRASVQVDWQSGGKRGIEARNRSNRSVVAWRCNVSSGNGKQQGEPLPPEKRRVRFGTEAGHGHRQQPAR